MIVNGPNVNKEDRFRLYQNYPNPASALTYFVYHLTQKGEVSIDILDINGKTIKTIMSQQVHGEGRYSIQLNVEAMASNLYFMRLYSNSEGTRTIKFVVEK
ncbi:MAG: T9SS type A sorting domain-containing protein [Bacteroidetes bacterium]|nr:T9SS type A sorting domain-containing protein [Bacteroidota bacterium]